MLHHLGVFTTTVFDHLAESYIKSNGANLATTTVESKNEENLDQPFALPSEAPSRNRVQKKMCNLL